MKNSSKNGTEVMAQIRPEIFRTDLGILLKKGNMLKMKV